MMMRLVEIILVTAIGFVPYVRGSSILVPRLSTAQCTGHLQDVVVTSVTCQYSEDGCTYGSDVFVTGQGEQIDSITIA